MRIWRILLALFVGYLAVYVTKTVIISEANWFAKATGFLVCSGFAYIGIVIGVAIRNALLPDYIITTGGTTSLIKTRLFWAYAFQIGGAIIGAILASALWFKWFGANETFVHRQKWALEEEYMYRTDPGFRGASDNNVDDLIKRYQINHDLCSTGQTTASFQNPCTEQARIANRLHALGQCPSSINPENQMQIWDKCATKG